MRAGVLLLCKMLMMVPQNNTFVLYDAAWRENRWKVVDDVVMGGRSSGHFVMEEDKGIFYGHVSLENQGGFSSARLHVPEVDPSPYEQLVLYVRGDGHRYQLRVKSSLSDRHSYMQQFEAPENWTEIRFMLSDFYPTYRGRKLQLPSYQKRELGEIGLLIANKKEQDFRLELKRIHLE